MKKSKAITLLLAPVLSTLLFSACGGGDEDSARDVYQSREDCLKDWSDGELCEEMNDGDSDEYRRSGVYVGGGRPIWGPRYYPGDRSVSYKGRTFAPSTRSTTLTPFTVSSRSSSASRGGSSSPSRSTSYSGFGSRSSSSSS